MKTRRAALGNFLWRHSAGIALTIMVLFVAGIGFIGYTYTVVTRKFDSSRRWDLPSRVYSDATPIVPGLTYPRALLEPKLNRVGYYEVARPISTPGEYRFRGDTLEIYLQNFAYPDMEFHAAAVVIEMPDETVGSIRRLEDGVALRGVRIEPELITSIYNDVMEDRLPVGIGNVPRVLIDAIIATEDRAFYRHEGISLRGILRAALHDLRTGSRAAGGSTLTQQLVKNFYLNPERTFRRKALEAVMAVLLEARYTKKEILEAYLNEIYLGQNGAVQIVGVEQASQVYFGKRAANLTLGEAATMAGMVRSPNVLSPVKYPERARARRDTVLGLMKGQGMISEAEFEDAVGRRLSVNRFPKSSRTAPFFVDLVLKQLRETYPETQLKTEGLRIFTTLDTMMQRSAELALDSGITALNKRYSYLRKSPTPLEGVVLTIQPGTGYVKALVGGRNYSKSQFNRAFQAHRQPGSLFKPFVYVAAMDPQRGHDALTAATILDDSPITVQSGNAVWRPQNYDNEFHGLLTVRRALAMSYNIPAVRAAIDAGVPNVIRMATRIGVQSKLAPYPSISLGSFEVTPLEIAYAYSVFANEGVKAEPISILAVSTGAGGLLENRNVEMKRVAPASVCYVMNDILKDVLDYGTGGRVRSLGFTRPFAAKTGTTSNYRDAWFVGYSPRVVSLVWIGFDDGHSVRLAGGDAAGPIWAAHMNRISGMIPNTRFRRPDDVVDREIDPVSGLLATPYCSDSRPEVFVRGTEPSALCSLHAGGELEFPLAAADQAQERIEQEQVREEEIALEGEKKEKKKKEEQGLKKILRWIFKD